MRKLTRVWAAFARLGPEPTGGGCIVGEAMRLTLTKILAKAGVATSPKLMVTVPRIHRPSRCIVCRVFLDAAPDGNEGEGERAHPVAPCGAPCGVIIDQATERVRVYQELSDAAVAMRAQDSLRYECAIALLHMAQ